MTREDIIRMAKEAGVNVTDAAHDERVDRLWRFADMVASAEREACCRAIDAIDDGEAPEYRACQEAIRDMNQA